ncbi:MAG: beta-hydroxyacyl-ACP dehydratase [Gammaproteobacteria bacterium]|nr:beta-hydroxyacyl-ACP dehydratase [Gammaproteobacteria bacterium]MCB1925620.1 beta-hydroxyacyl-ACP dehydratase [Gammaproteobacteria bacterium]
MQIPQHDSDDVAAEAEVIEQPLRLDMKGLLEYQCNRFPYLLVDVATEIFPGRSAKGFKNLTANDWFFDCHWPGDPNMPGMLQVEALVQLSALTVLTLPGNKGKVVYIASANNLKFARRVLPGDCYEMECELTSWSRGVGRCKAKATVNGEFTCSAEFNFVMPDILEQYRVGRPRGEAHADV